MKHRCIIYLVCLLQFASLLAASAFAHQQKLTNQDVINMVKAGLPPEIVVQTIKSNNNSFDISADALIVLKKAEIPDSVIQAMVARTQNTGTGETPSPLTVGNEAARVPVLVEGTNRIKLQYASPDTRSSGMFRLNPLSSKVRAALKGSYAQIRTTNPSPEFEISLPADAHPSDLVALVKLDIKSDRREVETFSVGVTGVKSGFPKGRTLPIDIEEVSTEGKERQGFFKLYRVKPGSSIAPGEYALVIQGITYFDFGVDAGK
jgi:hypothetical protein